jgi:hypothetical protein
MLEIIGWSAKHDPRTAADRRFVRRLHRDRAALETEIRSALVRRKTRSDAGAEASPGTGRPGRKKPGAEEVAP